VCLGIGELNSPYASEVVQVPRDLVVGRIGWELCLRNKEIGLCDVGGREIVSEEKRGDGCLRIWVFSKHCASESSKELSADIDNGRLLGWRLGVHLLVEEGEVEVCLCCERVERPPVQLADLVYQLLSKFGALFKFLLVVEIDLRVSVIGLDAVRPNIPVSGWLCTRRSREAAPWCCSC